jgi:hypothetical protein
VRRENVLDLIDVEQVTEKIDQLMAVRDAN